MASMSQNSSDGIKIRAAAESIFQLSSSASAETRNFLWPVLLSFLAAPAYHQAAGSVAKALEMIAIRQIQETHPLELPQNPPQGIGFTFTCYLKYSQLRIIVQECRGIFTSSKARLKQYYLFDVYYFFRLQRKLSLVHFFRSFNIWQNQFTQSLTQYFVLYYPD